MASLSQPSSSPLKPQIIHPSSRVSTPFRLSVSDPLSTYIRTRRRTNLILSNQKMHPHRRTLQQQGNLQFCSTFLFPFSSKKPRLTRRKTLILGVVTESSVSTKRPVCRKCSKPARVCLCNRLKTPALKNSVRVTILQHSLEKNHHLNSTRIAAIGLQNVDVVTVSEVNFQARFLIWLLYTNCKIVDAKMGENCQLFDEMPSREEISTVLGYRESDAFVVDLERNHRWTKPYKSVEITCDQLTTSNITINDIRKGFIVKKLQKWPSKVSNKCEEIEEFEIPVPAGSVLLFPSEQSIDVEAVNFEVKNLIVLDGTWAKAKRMYYENPWLRFLPHVRLDIDKMSLYREVRPQPRAGYLSTIESIVYALKAVGEDSEGLNGLLDVFESMVGDQRRCMNERLIKGQRSTD